jgi:hypothetical protein
MQLHVIHLLSPGHDESFLLREGRKAGFAEGLQTGYQEKELADLWEYVKQLEENFTRRATGVLSRLCRQEGTMTPMSMSRVLRQDQFGSLSQQHTKWSNL